MPIPEEEQGWWLSIEPNEQAWRYMSFPAFAKLMRSGELLFRRVSEFPDPYEGSIPHSLNKIRERDAKSSDISPKIYENVYSTVYNHARKCSYANCWHLNSGESEAMWQKYEGRGIAVVADTENLIPAFEKQDRILLARPVRYFDFFKTHTELSDDERSRLEGIAGELLEEYGAVNFLKRSSFGYENEFRILHTNISYMTIEEYKERGYNIVVDGEKQSRPLFTQKNGEVVCVDFTGIPEENKLDLTVDLSRLISEIRVAPGTGDWFYDTVCEVVDSIASELTPDIVKRSMTDVREPTR